MSLSSKVLIVGAGPTGMTAALELSRMGIPVRLIERTAEAATTSRAIGVQARTLELFQQRGLVDRMLSHGNKGVAGSIYGEGKRVFRLDFSNNGSRYGYMLFISQAETEATLREALARQGVSIEREVEFLALGQSEHGDHVKAMLRHKDGAIEEFDCDYLIDCEGAHSISRATMGLHFSGKTRTEDYVLGDLYIDGDLPSSDFHIFSSEFGFMGLFPMGDGRFRLIASNPLSEPNKDTAPSLEEIQKIYDQRSHIPARFHDMSWSSWFRINSRMVDRLREGRVFVGGDSAHIHSPAGAQGMNTGIQDMINLSWKLAFVLKGYARPELLDTYNDDRLPVIHNVLNRTEGLTDMIGSEDKMFRSVFSHIAPWVVKHELVQEKATENMSQLALGYRESPLSVSDSTVGTLRAGDRVPDADALLVGGSGAATQQPAAVTLLNAMSPDTFSLLFVNLADSDAVHRAVQSTLAPWKHLIHTVSVREADASSNGFRTTFGEAPGMLLVRPDGYVAFSGKPDDMDALARYLNEWFPQQQA